MAFKRREGLAGGGITRYADGNMPVCPYCGSTHPHWLMDAKIAKYSLIAAMCKNSYQFQCEECGGIVEIQATNDFCFQSENFTKISLLSAGNGTRNLDKVGSEITLSQLKELCSEDANDNYDETVEPKPVAKQPIQKEAIGHKKEAKKGANIMSVISLITCCFAYLFFAIGVYNLILSSFVPDNWVLLLLNGRNFSILSLFLGGGSLVVSILSNKLMQPTKLAKVTMILSIIVSALSFTALVIAIEYCIRFADYIYY